MVKTAAARVLVFVILAAAVLVTVAQTLPPAPLEADTPLDQFSAQRAFRHIQAVAREPRPTGSAANARARAHILAELADLGLETATQREEELVNVLARLPGSSADAVLLTAHLDTVAESPGASDDGSGVAVLLETARAMAAGSPLQNTVMFLFTDFEEGGLVGAEAFIRQHPWARDVRVVIGFDAGGLSGPGVLSAVSANNGWLIQQLARADRTLTGSSILTAFADSGTDFGHAFKPAGFSGYAFDLYWDRRIHTPDDNLGHVNLASLQHQGQHALALGRHLGNLTPLQDPGSPDAVYFNVLRLFTVVYPSIWAIPLAAAAAGIFLATLSRGLRRGLLTWGGMGYGMVLVLSGILLAPLPAILLGNPPPGLPLRYAGRSLDQPPAVAAAFLAALVLVTTCYFLAVRLRKASIAGLTMGALGFITIAAVGTSIAMPALSYAFALPALFSALACVAWFFRPDHCQERCLWWFLAAGCLTTFIMGPAILLGLFDQSTLASMLTGVWYAALLPLIYTMLGSNFDTA